MKKREIAYLAKYCSPSSILVVSKKGKLVELHCPFWVKAFKKVGKLTVGNCYEVEQVKIGLSGKSVFVISGNVYFYHYFKIYLN